MTRMQVETPDTTAVAEEATQVTVRAKQTQITTQAEYESAGEFAREIKRRMKAVSELMDPPIAKAHALHRDLTGRRKALLMPLEQAERHVKGLMSSYLAEEDRKRREEEARLREEARRKAEAEAAERRRAEEERRLAEASRLEAEGKAAEADRLVSEEIVTAPAEPEPIVLATPKPSADGVSARETWKVRIVDATKVPRQYLVPDEAALRRLATSLKGAAQSVVGPVAETGIEFYPEKSVSVRAF